jgi:hypothetical protein
VAERDALAEKVAAVIPPVDSPERLSEWPEDEVDYYRNGRWGDFTERGKVLDLMRRLKAARAVLAVPELAAALDLADRMRDAETGQEWGVRVDMRYSDGGRVMAADARAWAAARPGGGLTPVRRTTLRGPWEDVDG